MVILRHLSLNLMPLRRQTCVRWVIVGPDSTCMFWPTVVARLTRCYFGLMSAVFLCAESRHSLSIYEAIFNLFEKYLTNVLPLQIDFYQLDTVLTSVDAEISSLRPRYLHTWRSTTTRRVNLWKATKKCDHNLALGPKIACNGYDSFSGSTGNRFFNRLPPEISGNIFDCVYRSVMYLHKHISLRVYRKM